jgi:3D-(3,5/4)-trihydroxycyclohexane-1,2-dione acylhydrolase (decyclizing)
MAEAGRRLTTAQALIEFLTAQRVERDGVTRPLFAGCFGIFGHGNVGGLGQALHQYRDRFPYRLVRNEQAMVHAAAAYARMRNRLGTFACVSSIGPGATNMLTAAAGATINRLPVLLIAADAPASRLPRPVLQQLEAPGLPETSVNDSFRPVSRFWDRITRPEQLLSSALEAIRVLVDPAETGAVTLCLPPDVQAQACDWPEDFLAERVWHVARPLPDRAALGRAASLLRAARRPLVVAGGGVHYSEATQALRAFAEATGMPVAETNAGMGALPTGHPSSLGGLGVNGNPAANAVAARSDLLLGIGTRWSDVTTASQSLFRDPAVHVVNVNITPADAAKLAGEAVVGDVRETLALLEGELAGHRVDDDYTADYRAQVERWKAEVERLTAPTADQPPRQAQVIGALNRTMRPRDVVVNAAGSLPNDLHKLWRNRDPKGYQVEYGYSCMGYEIAGGMGAKLAAPDRGVYVLVGDGSYLMMPSEIVTCVQESIPLVVVLVQNHGFASVDGLARQLGTDGFGTRYRHRSSGERLPVDLAQNAESLGARVLRVATIPELEDALERSRDADHITVIHIETDYEGVVPRSAWWDVHVAEVADGEPARAARERYEQGRQHQRRFLGQGSG